MQTTLKIAATAAFVLVIGIHSASDLSLGTALLSLAIIAGCGGVVGYLWS